MREEGFSISSLHLRHLNPFPKDLEKVMNGFDKIIVPELNLGQLSTVLQSTFSKKVISYSKIQGKPFKVSELKEEFLKHLP